MLNTVIVILYMCQYLNSGHAQRLANLQVDKLTELFQYSLV